MNINAQTKLCMSIGDPISGSLSPVMHNAGYKALGVENQFVFVAVKVPLEKLKDTITAIKVLDIKAVSVTMPNKIAVMEYLDEVDKKALEIGAVNTIINSNGVLKGYNTDWIGAVDSLKQKTAIKGKKVALLGAGGAARAIAFGINHEGGVLTIYNRTQEKAEELVKKFGGETCSFEQIAEVINAEIVINATSVGMDTNETPLKKEFFKKGQIVLDIVYHPYETQFLKDAKENGAIIIYGTDMLVYQGAAQFEMYTGKKAPIKEMIKAVLKNI